MPATSSPPRVGMLATLRNRRAVIVAVEPYAAPDEGQVHLVRVEYTDADGPPEDAVVWEREPGTHVLEPRALPSVDGEPPMPVQDFDALVRAARWSALSPFVDPDGGGPLAAMPIAAPLFGAVQAEDFQLVPLLMALRAPRVSLLLADDVGLGKTVEAGLILTELLRRRRIRRVLILCPAALRTQWQQEMADKFSLSFEAVDRDRTHELQRQVGLDANPWRAFPRIIASYYYLRQPDVLEQFRAACRQSEGAAQLPWDLLIVDEAHNLTPAAYGEDSDLVKMLRTIGPWFEHRLFLTATPHNGHTRAFTGLLELLDPVRFTQVSDISDAMRSRVDDAVVRRFKSDINALDDRLDRPRRFPERHPREVTLHFGRRERALHEAARAFRRAVRDVVAKLPAQEQTAGVFAVEVLGKRLLSCPVTFAESWRRFTDGMALDTATTARDVEAARRASEVDLDDDEELEGRAGHAALTVGGWLRPLAERLDEPLGAVRAALVDLRLAEGHGTGADPAEDARWERLRQLVDERLRRDRAWVDDERLIVFTEYKTSLDYVARRLGAAYDKAGEGRIGVLYGGMDASTREAIKTSFNDPADPIRILVATDAASEGLNLQATARLILHWEIPWNPSRLEQRNGRLDRHGQARDVTVYHFSSEDDDDLRFMARVVQKVHTIREDLGAVGEVFDAAFQRRFIEQADADEVLGALDTDVSRARETLADEDWHRQGVGLDGVPERDRLDALCRQIDLSPATLRDTLARALGMGVGQPRLTGPDARSRYQLASPIPSDWAPLVDDTLRHTQRGAGLGALPGLLFDPAGFVTDVMGRPVFRPAGDTALLHLGHPLFQRALAQLTRARFPGSSPVPVSRWCARGGAVPDGAEAVVLVTVEELAINELREPFHHWVRTLRFPVRDGELGDALSPLPAADDAPGAALTDAASVGRAKAIWSEVGVAVRDAVRAAADALTQQLGNALETGRDGAIEAARAGFKERRREIGAALSATTLKGLERERDQLLAAMQQRALFGDIERERGTKLRDVQEELSRRRERYDELLRQLDVEQARVIERMLPRRHQMRGGAQVFPVAVEVRLPVESRA